MTDFPKRNEVDPYNGRTWDEHLFSQGISEEQATAMLMQAVINGGLNPGAIPEDSPATNWFRGRDWQKIMESPDATERTRQTVRSLTNPEPKRGDYYDEGRNSEITNFDELLQSLNQPYIRMGMKSVPYPQRKPEQPNAAPEDMNRQGGSKQTYQDKTLSAQLQHALMGILGAFENGGRGAYSPQPTVIGPQLPQRKPENK